MTRVYLLVEGQTEEAFVKKVLAPHFERLDLWLVPIIVSTSKGCKGGVVSYAKIESQIHRLCKQETGAYVTTLFDLYALPGDFPGKSDPAYPRTASGQDKAKFLEAELSKDIGRDNFIPNLLVHEFEALLFVEVNAFQQWTDDDRVLKSLRDARSESLPEDINDGAHTAPSKRILRAIKGYQKVTHGQAIACDIGLDAMRRDCMHFAQWLQKIEALKKIG